MELTFEDTSNVGGTLKSLFDTEVKSEFDDKTCRKIIMLQSGWLNRSNEHIEFMGNALIGTPKIRFVDSDREAWFDTILMVDDVVLKSEIDALEGIDPALTVATDAFNLTSMYAVHRILTNRKLSSKRQQQAAISTLLYLQYKFLSSLMAHRFRYEPSREIAEATYAYLSYRFSLKKAGSWQKLLIERSEDIIGKDSIHYKTLMRFDNNDDIRYLVTDVQGRIREIVKNITDVFYQVKQSDMSVLKRRAFMAGEDGELVLKDVIRKRTAYTRYIEDVVSAGKGFIKPELIDVIAEIQNTMPPAKLNITLQYMTDNYGVRGDKDISKLLEVVIQHAFKYIDENSREFRKGLNLLLLIKKLRSLYMSSRSSDPMVLAMRELAFAITKRAVNSNNDAMVSSVRNGVMLYIVARTFAMDYYTQGGAQRLV